MYNQRQNMDMDTMMGQAPTPGRRRPPTPIRKVGGGKPLLNKENLWANNNDFGRPDGIKKPLISPVRNPFKNQFERQQNEVPARNGWAENFEDRGVCKNHTGKQAEFQIEIDGQMLSYCNRCAAQLASQGFEVCKIEPSTVKKGGINNRKSQNMGRSLPRYPEYEGNPMYELILEFLTDLSQVENEHLHNMQKLTQIDSNYEKQIELTTDFYSELLSFIEQMRDDHLADLHEESRKHSQIADIEHDYLRENVDEMGNIRNDIEQNLETIVQKLEQQDLRNNLNYYKQKTEVYRQKVEEQAEFFDKLIAFTPNQYTQKLNKVQEFMMDVWSNDLEQRQPQRQFERQPVREFHSQRQMPNKTPSNRGQNDFKTQPQPQQQNYFKRPQPQVGMGKGFEMQGRGSGEEENQPAFRRLFDDEDQLMAETSPQFKKI